MERDDQATKRRRDRHGRHDSTASPTNAAGPRSTTGPPKQLPAESIELPQHDPTITPAAARALLRLILNVHKKQE